MSKAVRTQASDRRLVLGRGPVKFRDDGGGPLRNVRRGDVLLTGASALTSCKPRVSTRGSSEGASRKMVRPFGASAPSKVRSGTFHRSPGSRGTSQVK